MIQKYGNYKPVVHVSSYIAPGSMVIGDVELGENTSVWHNAVMRGDMAKISVGNFTNVQDGCLLHCLEGVELKVGEYVSIGHGAILHSCIIGNNTLIGMGAIVLDGAKVGNNCLVGAGAVVTPNSEIPDGSLVVGNPAKIKRQLTEDEILHIRKNAMAYVNLAGEYKHENSNN